MRCAQAWRRSSAEVLSHIISTASSSQQLTECRLTLVDLAGSEDVGRSGAASIVKVSWLALAQLATRRSRGPPARFLGAALWAREQSPRGLNAEERPRWRPGACPKSPASPPLTPQAPRTSP